MTITNDWLSIETAPTNTAVLLLLKSSKSWEGVDEYDEIIIGQYSQSEHNRWWHQGFDYTIDCEILGWMPLPLAPQ